MLKQVAAPAQAADAEAIGRDLLDTMRSFERCVGLAAPQIGELARVVVVDVRGHPKADDRQRAARARQPAGRRGGGLRGRPRGLPLDSRPDRERAPRDVGSWSSTPAGAVECEGFEARCVQHELDHLDGILFLDRVESLVDDVFRRRVYAEKPESRRLVDRLGRGRSPPRAPGRARRPPPAARIG